MEEIKPPIKININQLVEFLKKHYHKELTESSYEETPSFVIIDYDKLDKFDNLISEQLLEIPEVVLKNFEQAVKIVLPSSETKINVRIKNIPNSRSVRIRYLRAKHLNQLYKIDAVIKSASEVKPQIWQTTFLCPECDTKLIVSQEGNLVQKPFFCGKPFAEQGCGRRGDFGEPIEKKLHDFRYIVGIEPFELTTGEKPGEINILLKEDLTKPKMQKKTDPGANLKITGILKEIPKRIKGKLSTKIDFFIEANYVENSKIDFEELEITKEDEQKIKQLSKSSDIYERLKNSIAPGIYGFDEIKEAITLQLFGGIRHTLNDGSTIRGNIHILITGDPGVGKSQILKLVSGVVPRGRYVSGSGVSGAGLTATVSKNELLGSWVLEAGALILCNKGLISIDEFDKMSKDDQTAMHEATSIETVSIAKASIVATLPAQTAVLAGANPKYGRFDQYKPVAEQIQIPETLLSRFDLKFALRDIPEKENDEKLAQHILETRISSETSKPSIDTNLLRKYIAYAKQSKKIKQTRKASELMKDFYVKMRNRYTGDEIKTISITLRQYEALLRLAEASAKIRLDTKVTIEDAKRAINLVEYSLIQLGYDTETGRIDIDKTETKMTSTKRSRINRIDDLINDLLKGTNEIAEEDLYAEAENQGIGDRTKIKEIVRELLKEGILFEPKPGFLKRA